MNIVIAIIVGFIVGLIARFIMPGSNRMGFILTTALGIAGSALAHFGGEAIGFYRSGAPVGWIASIIGAIVLLALVDLLRGRR